jgi:hypothetical protein
MFSLPTCNAQAFHAIFISPSIEEDQYSDDMADSPPHQKWKISHDKAQTSHKSNIATILNMNGEVTGRAIAYVTVLVS